MTFPHGETVTVERPGEPDQWGQRTPGTTFTVGGCVFAPRTATEVTYQRVTTITGLTLYAPPGTDIRSTDVIRRSDGTRWHAVGEALVPVSPFTGLAPVLKVPVERVTG